MIEPGMLMSRSAAEMSLTASDSAAPGATLKLMVAAGNCSWCVMVSGAVTRSSVLKAPSGTCAVGVGGGPAVEALEVESCVLVELIGCWPDCAGTYRRLSQLGSVWYSGIASRMTRYWFDCPYTVEIWRWPNAELSASLTACME